MEQKLDNLGTRVDPRSFRYLDGQWYITVPQVQGRKGFFSIVAPWCGHCQHLSREMKDARTQTPFPSYYVVGDEDSASRGLANAMNVMGYPTVFVIERDGRLTPYEGDRSATSLISTVTGQQGGATHWSWWQ